MRSLSMPLLLLGLVIILGCSSGSDRIAGTDGGGVTLSVTDFDGLPTQVSVNLAAAVGIVTIDEITIESIVKNIDGETSDLMNVEMDSYEVTFSRSDGGTALPVPLVQKIFGVTPVGGTNSYENLPILTDQQLLSPPLSDLLIENGAFDKETGAQTIVLNLALRFFGRTISGEDVDSAPARFTVQFVP